MLNISLIKELLIISIATGIIVTALVQKIKENLKTKKYLLLISLLLSLSVGVLFSRCFTNISLLNSLWVGLFTFIGSDAIYKTFEEKIFTPFSKLQTDKQENNITRIEREK